MECFWSADSTAGRQRRPAPYVELGSCEFIRIAA